MNTARTKPTLSLPASPARDRRAGRRHAAGGIILVRPQEPTGALAHPARVLDISSGGVCLLVAHSFPVGIVLTVASVGWGEPFLSSVEVVHCRPTDGQWVHGCRFGRRLGHFQLLEWLRNHSREGP